MWKKNEYFFNAEKCEATSFMVNGHLKSPLFCRHSIRREISQELHTRTQCFEIECNIIMGIPQTNADNNAT